MRIIYATGLLILLSVVVLQNMLWLAAFLAVYFTYTYSAAALFLLAICIDAYFGAFSTLPYFSFVALVWYLLSELVRLRMRIMK
jgi:hypothetical protein